MPLFSDSIVKAHFKIKLVRPQTYPHPVQKLWKTLPPVDKADVAVDNSFLGQNLTDNRP